MAKQESNEVIDGLAESIGEVLERKRAAREKVPDVYKSGMRGNEDHPAKRREKEALEAAKKQGLRKGVDPAKVAKTKGGRVEDDEESPTGKRTVSFNAGPTKKALALENKKLKEQLAKATGKKVVI